MSKIVHDLSNSNKQLKSKKKRKSMCENWNILLLNVKREIVCVCLSMDVYVCVSN